VNKKKPTEVDPEEIDLELDAVQHLERALGAYRHLSQRRPEVTGSHGGKISSRTKRERRAVVEQFLLDLLRQRVEPDVILARAESKFPAFTRENLKRYYLRPVQRRARTAP
jgi:hypothetical protein